MLLERKLEMIAIRERMQVEYAKAMSTNSINTDLSQYLFFLFKKRIDFIGIRSYFVNTLYEYIKEQANLERLTICKHSQDVFHVKLPFIAEAIIAIQYYENQIIDGKGGIDKNGIPREKVQQNLLASHFLKDWLYDYIDYNVYPNTFEKQREINQRVRNIFQIVDLGQSVQLKYGAFKNFKEDPRKFTLHSKLDEFLNKEVIEGFHNAINKFAPAQGSEFFLYNYLFRIQMVSGSIFNIMALIIMNLLGYYGKERENILRFASSLGMVGQIVNDINDFVLPETNFATVAKVQGDAFSDLLNDNITLPIIFFLSKNKHENIHDLQQDYFYTPKKLFSKLLPSIKRSIEVGEILGALSNSYLNLENSKAFLLSDMNSISKTENNKYYREIEKTEMINETNLSSPYLRKHSKTTRIENEFVT